MCILSDEMIKEYSLKEGLIAPFEPSLISNGIISFGLSSYGYDIRLSKSYRRIVDAQKLDPKNLSFITFKDEESEKIILNPFENILALSYEYLKIPRDILAICIGKSSYARLGLIINITPLEPEWEGYITISIINCTKYPFILYANEGIAQVIFFKAHSSCSISYKDRKGKYQKQSKIEFPKI